MEPKNNQSLPFITRDMLSFEHATTFSLICRIQSDDIGPLTIRGATKEGPFTLRLEGSPSGDFAVTTHTFNLPDLPIWLSVQDEIGGFSPGNVFVAIMLGVNGVVSHGLMSGYVHQQQPLSWPQADLRPQDPFARLRTTTGANPAAGAETSITVPAHETWRLISWDCQLVTDGNAANRIVHLKATNGGIVLFEVISATTQIASLTRNYHGNQQSVGGAAADDNDILLALPHNIILPATTTITTETTGIQATDNWGQPHAFFERWLTI